MQDLEGAIAEAKERLSKLDKLWPSKESRTKFIPSKILCFVDANERSNDALRISLQLSQEFDTEFSIRSFFDKELIKIAETDLTHIRASIIQLVKDYLRDTGLSQGVTFLDGDAIESIETQLSSEYDIIVLPVPYHSNLSDHPEAVALGSLGEYLVANVKKPLFLVPDVSSKKEDLFQSIVIVVSDISDIIQNQNYIRAISRNRSHLHFVFLYDEKDIDNLAEASTGIVDAELVKKRVRAKLETYGKHTVDQFGDQIESVEYSVFSGEFSENIHDTIKEKDASLLTIILPENKKGYRYLLFQDILRDKKIDLPVMVLRVLKEEKEKVKDKVEDEIEVDEEVIPDTITDAEDSQEEPSDNSSIDEVNGES